MYGGRKGGAALDALRHPLRVRIVEACTEWGALSPTEIVNRGLCADVATLQRKSPRQQLSNVAYHCRSLADAGLLTLDRERPVRGATEHFYSATTEAVFTDEQWDELDHDERVEISQVVWHRLVAQVESATHADTFDSRTDRMLAWGPLVLDEMAWDQLASHMADSYHAIERIRLGAERRLSEPGAKAIKATYGLLLFESPNRRAGE